MPSQVCVASADLDRNIQWIPFNVHVLVQSSVFSVSAGDFLAELRDDDSRIQAFLCSLARDPLVVRDKKSGQVWK